MGKEPSIIKMGLFTKDLGRKIFSMVWGHSKAQSTFIKVNGKMDKKTVEE